MAKEKKKNVGVEIQVKEIEVHREEDGSFSVEEVIVDLGEGASVIKKHKVHLTIRVLSRENEPDVVLEASRDRKKGLPSGE